MNIFEGNSSDHSDIVHVMTNRLVRIVNYDKRTGQVSFSPRDSSHIYTCYDYDLVSLKGIDHLRSVLSESAMQLEKAI